MWRKKGGGRDHSVCVLEYHRANSAVALPRAFLANYVKDPPVDKNIRAWFKQFTKTGCPC
jgi:hypothetical protein